MYQCTCKQTFKTYRNAQKHINAHWNEIRTVIAKGKHRNLPQHVIA